MRKPKIKIFVASFSRASNGAIEPLIDSLIKRDVLTDNIEDANYILAVGDRIETYNFVLQQWLNGKKIIHLWAGEVSQGTYDEVFRHSLTLMSDLQFCTNSSARRVVERLCKNVGKKPNAHVIGNIMADSLKTDDSVFTDDIKKQEYLLVLYNPCLETIDQDLKDINDEIILSEKPYIWISPNMDKGYEKVIQANTKNMPRPKFLALLKHCAKFISNSSCTYYEAPFFLKPEQIVRVGLRNKDRNSTRGMSKKYATKKVIKEILKLDSTYVARKRGKRVPLAGETQGQPETGK